MGQNPEAERYWEAAERILEQLDWATNYLYRIRKDTLADVLSRNCDSVRRSLGSPPQTPTPKTSATRHVGRPATGMHETDGAGSSGRFRTDQGAA